MAWVVALGPSRPFNSSMHHTYVHIRTHTKHQSAKIKYDQFGAIRQFIKSYQPSFYGQITTYNYRKLIIEGKSVKAPGQKIIQSVSIGRMYTIKTSSGD